MLYWCSWSKPMAGLWIFFLQIATRKAYGMALAKLGRYNERVVVLDGDTNNLTCSEIFKNEHPNRFVECYIAQQNMVWSPKNTYKNVD